jgi:hypothetical protein
MVADSAMRFIFFVGVVAGLAACWLDFLVKHALSDAAGGLAVVSLVSTIGTGGYYSCGCREQPGVDDEQLWVRVVLMLNSMLGLAAQSVSLGLVCAAAGEPTMIDENKTVLTHSAVVTGLGLFLRCLSVAVGYSSAFARREDRLGE